MHKKILISINDDTTARSAISEGLDLARNYKAEVVFFHVLPSYSPPITDGHFPMAWTPEQHIQTTKRKAAELLDYAAAQARRYKVKSVGYLGSNHDAAACIAKEAVNRKCDLIVIGSHGRTALQRLMYGSVVTRLITLSTVPMLVCKGLEKVTAASAQVIPLKQQVKKLVAVPKPRRRAPQPVAARVAALA